MLYQDVDTPLHEETHHYVHEVGYVCGACHELMDIVRQRAWFQEMHRLWKQGLEGKEQEDGGTAHA